MDSTRPILDIGSDAAARHARASVIRTVDRPVVDFDGSTPVAPLVRRHHPALLIVDRLCDLEAARSATHPPLVLYLAASGDDRTSALERGADAAMAGSVSAEELSAQVHALLRRHRHSASLLRDELVATLSHELRNPLAAIRYALPVIQRERLGDSGGRAVNVIHRQVDHLSRMVDDLLDVSRVVHGTLQLKTERVDLRHVVTVAVEAASDAVVRGHHQLRQHLPDRPVWLQIDPLRVSQIVTQLLHNAATFTPRGGDIAVEVVVSDHDAAVAVRDTGSGIPSESLTEIFELFHQLHRPDAVQAGLGIGLTLARRLAELHGGTLEARSEGPGRGSEFVLHLPAPDAGGHADGPEPVQGPAPTRRLRVLIVDDNADLVEMLMHVVRDMGHEVSTALDGRQAIEAALAVQPDVVLLDLGLPLVSGIDVARQLRDRPETERAALIAFTGWGQADDRSRTLAAGFDYHMTKPADLDALTEVLESIAASRSR